MMMPSKLQCMLLLLGVSCLSLVTVSLGGETRFSDSLISSLGIPQAKDVVTCPVPLDQCGSECARRCSATSHVKPCLFFCNKCCNKCLCVPPGTYGQKECCPCYNDWKTQEGGPKCP